MTDSRETQHENAKAYLAKVGNKGAIPEEIGLAFGWPHQTYSAVCSTLKKQGDIIRNGKRRPTQMGNPAWVLVLPEFV